MQERGREERLKETRAEWKSPRARTHQVSVLEQRLVFGQQLPGVDNDVEDLRWR